MRLLIAAICLLLPGMAFAGEKLSPTMLQSVGDCVTPRISAQSGKTQEEVDFFTDRCGETEGVAYISLNGRDYTLRRVTPPAAGPVPYEGGYEGEGLTVEVKAGKLLKREFTPEEEGDPAEVMSEEYAVTVIVSKDGASQSITGTYWQGH